MGLGGLVALYLLLNLDLLCEVSWGICRALQSKSGRWRLALELEVEGGERFGIVNLDGSLSTSL
jgi:hypothetical protein